MLKMFAPMHTNLKSPGFRITRSYVLATWSRQAHLTLRDQIGMGYNPLTKKYFLQNSLDVNYLACYEKPAV